MPHVSIKCHPGRTDEQKKLLAEQITNALVEVFDCKERSVSISIQDVPKELWGKEVWVKEIVPQRETLYKEPGYKMDL